MSHIHQELSFPAPASWVYEVLVDPRRFAALTRSPATGEAVEGARFSAFDGRVVGRYIELVPSRRIVQAWREMTWPEGIYSVARFELEERMTSSIYGGATKLVLDHDGFPPDETERLSSGWQTHYWSRILGAFC